ncbi:MAG: DUF192 domain-containing protein [Gemmatimonadota bacterium]
MATPMDALKKWTIPALLAVPLAAWTAGCGGGAPGASSEAAAAVDRSAPRQETGRPRVDPSTGRLIRTQNVTVGGVPILVEIADTDALRQLGLMNRDSLETDAGMLFIYPEERILSFWMRNTRIPLDIAFIDRTGRIVNIEPMEAQTDTTHESRGPAMYALEMALGWFAAHGVGPGDRLEF